MGECATCVNWRPNPPEEWKPSFPGEEFGVYGLRSLMVESGKWLSEWPGICGFMPQPVEKRAREGCGQHRYSDTFNMAWHDFQRLTMDYDEISRLRGALRDERKAHKETRQSLREAKRALSLVAGI